MPKTYHVRAPLSDGTFWEGDFDHNPTDEEVEARVGSEPAPAPAGDETQEAPVAQTPQPLPELANPAKEIATAAVKGGLHLAGIPGQMINAGLGHVAHFMGSPSSAPISEQTRAALVPEANQEKISLSDSPVAWMIENAGAFGVPSHLQDMEKSSPEGARAAQYARAVANPVVETGASLAVDPLSYGALGMLGKAGPAGRALHAAMAAAFTGQQGINAVKAAQQAANIVQSEGVTPDAVEAATQTLINAGFAGLALHGVGKRVAASRQAPATATSVSEGASGAEAQAERPVQTQAGRISATTAPSGAGTVQSEAVDVAKKFAKRTGTAIVGHAVANTLRGATGVPGIVASSIGYPVARSAFKMVGKMLGRESAEMPNRPVGASTTQGVPAEVQPSTEGMAASIDPRTGLPAGVEARASDLPDGVSETDVRDLMAMSKQITRPMAISLAKRAAEAKAGATAGPTAQPRQIQASPEAIEATQKALAQAKLRMGAAASGEAAPAPEAEVESPAIQAAKETAAARENQMAEMYANLLGQGVPGPEMVDRLQTETSPTGRVVKKAIVPEVRVPMQPIASRAFTQVGYSPKNRLLQVEYANGGTYQYQGVSPLDFQRAMEAESKGAALLKLTQKAKGGEIRVQSESEGGAEETPEPAQAAPETPKPAPQGAAAAEPAKKVITAAPKPSGRAPATNLGGKAKPGPPATPPEGIESALRASLEAAKKPKEAAQQPASATEAQKVTPEPVRTREKAPTGAEKPSAAPQKGLQREVPPAKPSPEAVKAAVARAKAENKGDADRTGKFGGKDVKVGDVVADGRKVIAEIGDDGSILTRSIKEPSPETPTESAKPTVQSEFSSGEWSGALKPRKDGRLGYRFTTEDGHHVSGLVTDDAVTLGTVKAEGKGKSVIDALMDLARQHNKSKIVFTSKAGAGAGELSGVSGAAKQWRAKMEAKGIGKQMPDGTFEIPVTKGTSGSPAPTVDKDLQDYASNVVKSKLVHAVHLVGSMAAKGKGNDTDIVYDFGERKLPSDSGKAAAAVEALIEKSKGIDLDKYDTFIKVGDRYFHVSGGAGREVVENSDYGKQQEGKPTVTLAGRASLETAEAPSHEFNGNQYVLRGPSGEPLVVYHGSVNQVKAEDLDPAREPVRPRTSPNGIYFTSDSRVAASYAHLPHAPKGMSSGSVVKAHISMRNPLDITDDIRKGQRRGLSFGDAKRRALAKLTQYHDGVIFRGNAANAPEYVVFSKSQVHPVEPTVTLAKKG